MSCVIHLAFTERMPFSQFILRQDKTFFITKEIVVQQLQYKVGKSATI